MSEITIENVRDYLRILDDSEDNQLQLLLGSAISHVTGLTGLDEEIVKTQGDLKLAILILISDFYWNRDYQTSNKYNNKLVDKIISNNRVNFVGDRNGNNDGNV